MSAKARQALLLCLAHHPALAAVFWLSAVHLTAWGTLPDQVVHRLGYRQEPFVLTWRPAPPQATFQPIRNLLNTALGPGIACLALIQSHTPVASATDVPGAISALSARQALQLTYAHFATVSSATSPPSGPPGPPSLMTPDALFFPELGASLRAGAGPLRLAAGVVAPEAVHVLGALADADCLPYSAMLEQLGVATQAGAILAPMRELAVKDARILTRWYNNTLAAADAAGARPGAPGAAAASNGLAERPSLEVWVGQ